MRAVIQKVSRSSVRVNDQVVGQIEVGFTVFLGVKIDDDEKDADYMIQKISGLRIFEDEEGKMNLSLSEVGGQILLISQFTLYGDARKGRRPSFIEAAPGEKGEKLYEAVVRGLREKGLVVEKGLFGADMEVSIVNDGPVTILLDSRKIF